jgi:hypothetical protein
MNYWLFILVLQITLFCQDFNIKFSRDGVLSKER